MKMCAYYNIFAQFKNVSLYVMDLDTNALESRLFDMFNQIAQVIPIKLCKDQIKHSPNYAYVNFVNAQNVAIAMQHLNFSLLNGKLICISL